MLTWLLANSLAVLPFALVLLIAQRGINARPGIWNALWALALLRLILPPIVDWPWQISTSLFERTPVAAVPAPVEIDEEERMRQLLALAYVQVDGLPEIEATEPEAPPPAPFDWKFALAIGWGSGAAVVLVRGLIGIRRFRRLARHGIPAEPALLGEVDQLAGRLRCRAPGVRVLAGLLSPLVWVFGRPTLYWPFGLESRLSESGRHAVLTHELAHLRRKDHWMRRLEIVAGLLHWWNPLFWVIRSQLRKTSELACDWWVVQMQPAAKRSYAEALLEISRGLSTADPVPALGIRGGNRRELERRLAMIMLNDGKNRRSRRAALAIGAVGLMVLPGWSFGQAENPKAAEEKSAPQPDGGPESKIAAVEELLKLVLQAHQPSEPPEPAADAGRVDAATVFQLWLGQFEQPTPAPKADDKKAAPAQKPRVIELEYNLRPLPGLDDPAKKPETQAPSPAPKDEKSKGEDRSSEQKKFQEDALKKAEAAAQKYEAIYQAEVRKFKGAERLFAQKAADEAKATAQALEALARAAVGADDKAKSDKAKSEVERARAELATAQARLESLLKGKQTEDDKVRPGVRRLYLDKTGQTPDPAQMKALEKAEQAKIAEVVRVLQEQLKTTPSKTESPPAKAKSIDENEQLLRAVLREIEAKSQILGKDHPEMVALVQRLEDLARRIQAEKAKTNAGSGVPSEKGLGVIVLDPTVEVHTEPQAEGIRLLVQSLDNSKGAVWAGPETIRSQTIVAAPAAGQVETLERAVYNVPGKAAAVAKFIKENVKAKTLEITSDADTMTITTEPAVQKVIGQFIALMLPKVVQSNYRIWLGDGAKPPEKPSPAKPIVVQGGPWELLGKGQVGNLTLQLDSASPAKAPESKPVAPSNGKPAEAKPAPAAKPAAALPGDSFKVEVGIFAVESDKLDADLLKKLLDAGFVVRLDPKTGQLIIEKPKK